MVPKPIRITLAGNPNCGKTELFNALTGSHQRVGNWSGVTVDKKTGDYRHNEHHFDVTDLPGIYSLEECAGDQAVDSAIACQYLCDETPDVLVNVVDASQLKRHFFLTAQLTERNIPMVIAVNMMDVADKKGLDLNLKALSKKLGCPVIGLIAKRKIGVESLREAISQQAQQKSLPRAICRWPKTETEDAHLDAAAVYYDAASYLYHKTVSQQQPRRKLTSHWLDRIVLNRYAGIPIFLAIMYLMFVFSINIGGAFQDFFDIGSDTLFVGGTAHMLQWLHAPHWLSAILADGLGRGINTVLTFIPVIGAMFLFLALLEDSGYLSRAAFVMDRLMQKLGLPGQSFIPLVVGFGCNVPAVMGARTLPNPRDRILTIIMTPFMSCGARLAIFAVFASAFFPHGGQNIIFLLYLIGLLAAIGTGYILRKVLLPGKPAPLIMELPEYHLPSLRSIRRLVWQRLKGFLWRAGRYIVPICILIGGLNAIELPTHEDQEPISVLSIASQSITPVLAPMGIHPDNWPATVGLLTGVLAKEVVVGTLNTLYSSRLSNDNYSLSGGLHAALVSVPDNLASLNAAFANPFLAAEAAHDMSAGAMQTMVAKFATPLAAFAYLVFILLYFPCISTLAAMMREIPRDWAIFSVVWTTSLAYAAAVCIYQLGSFSAHPVTSLLWTAGCILMFATTLTTIRYARSRGRFTLPTVIPTGTATRCSGCSTSCEPPLKQQSRAV
jgi:ferrous iron transport protein B